MTFHWIFKESNKAGVASGAGTAYPSGAPAFNAGEVFYQPLVFLSFSFWPFT
jgi:hypothetical protein